MPFTVITLKKVPPSLRGDLTKWMQEIATGVYVGNFNSRIRENLWKRVCEDTESGEVTMSYMSHNEIGYDFQTRNAERKVVNYDGIPLVLIPCKEKQKSTDDNLKAGYSRAAKLQKAKRYMKPAQKAAPEDKGKQESAYVVIDVETTGLDETKDQLLEIGAVKNVNGEISTFQMMLRIDGVVPEIITKITGITTEIMQEEGVAREIVLGKFSEFILNYDLVGYNIQFDVKFLNAALRRVGRESLNNRVYDLMRTVKKEKLFQSDYKLQTSLKSYGIYKTVPHRALEDAKLIYELSTKVNKFRS